MSEEITDDDYLCAECIERADCCVGLVYSWYLAPCWLCQGVGQTMQVRYITVKEK